MWTRMKWLDRRLDRSITFFHVCSVFLSKYRCPCCSSRSRGLYHRSWASAASVGRSSAGSVCGGRSPVSDPDGEPADETLQRPLPHLYQQTGPHGRQPQPSPAADEVKNPHSTHLLTTVYPVGPFLTFADLFVLNKLKYRYKSMNIWREAVFRLMQTYHTPVSFLVHMRSFSPNNIVISCGFPSFIVVCVYVYVCTYVLSSQNQTKPQCGICEHSHRPGGEHARHHWPCRGKELVFWRTFWVRDFYFGSWKHMNRSISDMPLIFCIVCTVNDTLIHFRVYFTDSLTAREGSFHFKWDWRQLGYRHQWQKSLE